MRLPALRSIAAWALLPFLLSPTARAQNTRATETYRQMKAYLDSVPAIDTHSHVLPFDQLTGLAETKRGPGMNLAALWRHSYYAWTNPLAPWKPGMAFDEWWADAADDFVNARATSFYQYMLPAFTDLYGLDFSTITSEEAAELDRRIFENYKDRRWLYHVVTERANIELIVNDPYWARLEEVPDYPFCATVFNVTSLVQAFDRNNYTNPSDDPYLFADRNQINVDSLDDYLALLNALFEERKNAGAVCLKTTLAYQRSLRFRNVSRKRAEKAFGRRRENLTAREIRDFEDFIMWRLVELAAAHDLPFQIHTGQARIQDSDPMFLVDLIEANPKTKFILFHGGFPWVAETGAIAMWARQRHGNVWIDSCWLPTLSYSMAKRAYNEWLEMIPSDQIMWGSDVAHAEGVYAASQFTRRCLAEVLAEKVNRGDLCGDDARRIGRQILRDNALTLFPSLEKMLWKKGDARLTPAGASRPSQ